MSDLPKCLLCQCAHVWTLDDGTVIHPTDKSRPCALNGIEVTPEQWTALMGAGGEPVAWLPDDHLTDKSATTYSREVAERWKEKGWPVQPLYAGRPPAQRFQQIGFTRQDHIGKPSSTIIADTKYRAASDEGVYVPVFVGGGEDQAPAVDGAVLLDAERYRWLREQHKKHLGLTICAVGMYDLVPWSGDDPDSAIDSAIKGEG